MLLCAAAGILFCSCTEAENKSPSETNILQQTETAEEEITVTYNTEQMKKLLSCSYFDGRDFDRFEKECTEYDMSGEILCGTVPHHLLAGKLISGFFRAAEKSRDRTDTVIIIATMHDPENAPLCTSELDWNTPFGIMETDTKLVSLFKERLGAESNDNMLMRDHSASSIIPFAKYYFPDAKCACLLVSSGSESTVPSELAELIGEYSADNSCLTVFSTDFSHYLDPAATDSMDKQTYSAVMESRYDEISRMTNANVDSARCLETFTRLSDSICSQKLMLDHSNSLILSAVPYSKAVHGEGLTSYYVFSGIG